MLGPVVTNVGTFNTNPSGLTSSTICVSLVESYYYFYVQIHHQSIICYHVSEWLALQLIMLYIVWGGPKSYDILVYLSDSIYLFVSLPQLTMLHSSGIRRGSSFKCMYVCMYVYVYIGYCSPRIKQLERSVPSLSSFATTPDYTTTTVFIMYL